MILTFIGLIQCALGLWIVARGTLNHAFAFMLASTLLGGSAAAQVTALGNSTIPPLEFSLAFVFLRLLMPRGGYAAAIPDAIRANLPLVFFALYGVAAASAAPRIFAGQINVVPLRFDTLRSLFDTVPLRPTPQNITASVYLMGTVSTAIAAHVACRYRGGALTLVKAGIAIAWFHSLTGIVGSLTRGTAMDMVFSLFRNASYAQLDQAYQGFVRINGLFPEASAFAAYGLGWLIFNCECWYRSIMPRQTGRAALVLGATLFFSTSSTAYVGLGAYGCIFVARALLVPASANRERLGQAALAAVGALALACVAMAVIPRLPAAVWEMLLHMTVDKEGSDSGRQRLFWAMQGWQAFVVSGELGIGPGSFRSSSLIMAILGSMGVAGLACFTVYLWRVFQPQRASTWGESQDAGQSLGGAASFTALVMLIPAAISAPSADPGNGFAIFAAAALALRPRQYQPSRRFPPETRGARGRTA